MPYALDVSSKLEISCPPSAERYALLELLHQNLAKPDPEIDRVWQEEALHRLAAYYEGRLECLAMEDAFRDF